MYKLKKNIEIINYNSNLTTKSISVIVLSLLLIKN